jgi:aminoglycoside phosphotransferase (APT) family kinase protein
MSKPDVDLAEIAAGLSEAFPDLAPVRLVGVLGHGFNSIAIETDGGMVFRIARTEGTAQRFARERDVLHVIRMRLRVAVPEPRWFVASSLRFPLGVSGYRKIEGQTLSPALLREDNVDKLAQDLGGVLAALHRMPVDSLPAASRTASRDMLTAYRAVREKTSPALRERLSKTEYERVDGWWHTFLSDERLVNYQPTPVHNDFWYENFLVDARAERLTAVLDWEFCDIGDPAVDFATLLHLGRDFTERVVAAYRSAGCVFEEPDRHRASLLWELREFYGVLYSINFADEDELSDALLKLRAGPLFDARKAFLIT